MRGGGRKLPIRVCPPGLARAAARPPGSESELPKTPDAIHASTQCGPPSPMPADTKATFVHPNRLLHTRHSVQSSGGCLAIEVA